MIEESWFTFLERQSKDKGESEGKKELSLNLFAVRSLPSPYRAALSFPFIYYGIICSSVPPG